MRVPGSEFGQLAHDWLRLTAGAMTTRVRKHVDTVDLLATSHGCRFRHYREGGSYPVFELSWSGVFHTHRNAFANAS
ncbi:hypothetical protein AN216_02600 [Streptomyces oceani]|uniref:Uncharacterized protein n=1 Tax=Streptomyces oceani TaxID=1075402 RepID=A0A1E7KNM2_9ACTN|nr:hypothetical protein AN216_02600 [Streptomyces oceani]